MARPKKYVEITTAKIKGKDFHFIEGIGPNGPYVEMRGDNVRFINPIDGTKRDMSYVGSAIKLMVETQ